ncbi:hypothetical protein W97_03674 [Coniosporium apollinis CBS 100218]|uniref:DUF300-domain-containing protein n=1 Tax=Coniosporium apollinis (strain CBS 100218) TaxID=1168221 RepID=R7YRF8_CONA1|nr:uncharacterized protein W97_03674 [Coniosporium apollinis CBS 100218]EON64443.1 hypothetical protein W97_03674 [Coniosporium apollinis CBS 100218]
MPHCKSTLAKATVSDVPLWKSGLSFQQLALSLAFSFGVAAVATCLYLIYQHATHYLRPWEQKHIIRILLVVPIYAVVSFLSILKFRYAIYLEVLRDCYEAFAIASFFTLLAHYVAPNLHDQKEYFRELNPKNWIWPINWLQACTGGRKKGPFRRPQSGLTWFNIIWFCVFQYCLIRVACTVVSVFTQMTGLYCDSSLSPHFAHLWIFIVESISVAIAMLCLVQFYVQLKQDLASHYPFLKLLSIKLVVFLCFWQRQIIDFLIARGAIEPSKKLGYPDIQVGIPGVLVCIEMAGFATIHLFAFSWREYKFVDGGQHRAVSPPRFLPHHILASAIFHSTIFPPPNNNHGLNLLLPEPLQRMTRTSLALRSRMHQAPYHGGPLGALALLDAFNPWDIVKASARSYRWLCVGARRRKADRSYALTKRNPTPYPSALSLPGSLDSSAHSAGTSPEASSGNLGERAEARTERRSEAPSLPPPRILPLGGWGTLGRWGGDASAEAEAEAMEDDYQLVPNGRDGSMAVGQVYMRPGRCGDVRSSLLESSEFEAAYPRETLRVVYPDSAGDLSSLGLDPERDAQEWDEVEGA